MSTDYQIAKQIPVELQRFEEKNVTIGNLETFRRYLCEIAKKADMQFTTKKVDDTTVSILRIK